MSSDSNQKYYDALPLLITVCLLPFVVRGHIYEYSGESYGTFIEDVTLSDFFSYSKSLVFAVVGMYMLYRITVDMMQGRMKRPCFVLTVSFSVLGLFLLISAAFAFNRHIAFFGGYQRFEGAITKLFYIVLALYTFHVFESRDVRDIVRKGAIAAAVPECVIGLMQMTGHDPFATSFLQKLVLPGEYRGSEITNILGDSRVYLTLSNPNYAAMYLAAMIILITCSIGFAKSRRNKALLALLNIICFIELVATRSRVGILMLIAPAAVWIAVNAKDIWENKRMALNICILAALMIISGIITDSIMHLGMWERIGTSLRTLGQDQRNCNITAIETSPDNVLIDIGDITVIISFKDAMDEEHLQVYSELQSRDYGSYDRESGMIVDENNQAAAGLEDLKITAEDVDEEPMIIVNENGSDFLFSYDSEHGYMIYAGNGYYEYTEEIESVDMHGFESFASGRGYIWSRTLPLIRGLRSIAGYGSDNFYLAFPQNDYVGKAQYCDNPYVIIEKPHNTFLLYCAENGIFALLAFGTIIIYSIVISLKRTNRHDPEYLLNAMLLVSFAAGLFFNDSSIVISPLLWITVGAACRL